MGHLEQEFHPAREGGGLPGGSDARGGVAGARGGPPTGQRLEGGCGGCKEREAGQGEAAGQIPRDQVAGVRGLLSLLCWGMRSSLHFRSTLLQGGRGGGCPNARI